LRLKGPFGEPKTFPDNFKFGKSVKSLFIAISSKARWCQIDLSNFNEIEQVVYHFCGNYYNTKTRFQLHLKRIPKEFIINPSPKFTTLKLSYSTSKCYLTDTTALFENDLNLENIPTMRLLIH
jgi:hypothetical protein